MLGWTNVRPPKRKGPAIAGESLVVGLGEVYSAATSWGSSTDASPASLSSTISSIAVSCSIAAVSSTVLSTWSETLAVSDPCSARPGVRSGSGSQPRTREHLLGLPRQVSFLQLLDALRLFGALGLAHGFNDSRFGHAAEEIIDGRRPAGRGDVERQDMCETIRVSDGPWPAAPGFMHGVDGKRDAMGEEALLRLGVEGRQSVPQIAGIGGKLLRPVVMTRVDFSCERRIAKSRGLSAEGNRFRFDLQTGVGAVMVEQF